MLTTGEDYAFVSGSSDYDVLRRTGVVVYISCVLPLCLLDLSPSQVFGYHGGCYGTWSDGGDMFVNDDWGPFCFIVSEAHNISSAFYIDCRQPLVIYLSKENFYGQNKGNSEPWNALALLVCFVSSYVYRWSMASPVTLIKLTPMGMAAVTTGNVTQRNSVSCANFYRDPMPCVTLLYRVGNGLYHNNSLWFIGRLWQAPIPTVPLANQLPLQPW